MRFLKTILFLIVINSLTSCGLSRPITAVFRNNRVVVKDNIPGRIKISSEYNYISLRRFVLLGMYKSSKVIDVDNGRLLEVTHYRKTAGFSPDKPYYVTTKKILFDNHGKREIVTKVKYKWESENVKNKIIYYKKGKKISVENCLK